MNKDVFSKPIDIKRIKITDDFWEKRIALVRNEVLPYQWEILNGRVEDASPSFCMHNFKVAGKMQQQKRDLGENYVEPQFTYRGFECLPEDQKKPDEDKFYGFVFQDSDFSKWIEAVGYSLAQKPDPELKRIADEAIDIVCAAQLENGYLDTYYIINGMDKAFTNLRDHHELYCFGHFVEGAVSYYRATGERRILDAAIRFADYIDSVFGPEKEKCKGYPGHEIAEMALVKLYEETVETRYLHLAAFFLNERGKRPYYFDKEHAPEGNPEHMRYQYHQAHMPVRKQREAVGHAVRAVYLYSGMADVARLTQDDEMWEAANALWDSIVNEKMYITGGIGGTHVGEAFSFPFDLPSDTAYAETCASIGLAFFARRMLQIEPSAEYADVMEKALYNGILSGMGLDGKSFFYVNPLEVFPEACHNDERKKHVKPSRQKWFGCACCPPNLARIISSIGMYAYTEKEDTIFVHLYMSSLVDKEVSGKKMQLRISSNFPIDGEVKATVNCEESVSMTLAFRIPEWCEKEFEVPRFLGKKVWTEKGYLYVAGVFHDAEELQLHFPMRIRIMESDARVRENEGMLAITRGPIVYCMEEADNGKNLHRLRIQPEKGFREITIETLGSDVVCLEGHAKRELETEKGLYHEYIPAQYERVNVKWIPYCLWANRGEGEMRVFFRYE